MQGKLDCTNVHMSLWVSCMAACMKSLDYAWPHRRPRFHVDFMSYLWPPPAACISSSSWSRRLAASPICRRDARLLDFIVVTCRKQERNPGRKLHPSRLYKIIKLQPGPNDQIVAYWHRFLKQLPSPDEMHGAASHWHRRRSWTGYRGRMRCTRCP